MYLKKNIIISVILMILFFKTLPVMAETAEEWKTKGNEYLDGKSYDKALDWQSILAMVKVFIILDTHIVKKENIKKHWIIWIKLYL